MDTEITKYLINTGTVGILAAVFYYQNNKNALEYARQAAEQAKIFADRIETLLNIERGRTEMLVKLVIDNTSQTTANTEVVRALHKRLDHEHLPQHVHSRKED
jgi:hypothetical protein